MVTLALVVLTAYLFLRRRTRRLATVTMGMYYCAVHEGMFTVVGAPDVACCPSCTSTFKAMEQELVA
jgi:uncharacterized MnhB-related membrane protein